MEHIMHNSGVWFCGAIHVPGARASFLSHRDHVTRVNGTNASAQQLQLCTADLPSCAASQLVKITYGMQHQAVVVAWTCHTPQCLFHVFHLIGQQRCRDWAGGNTKAGAPAACHPRPYGHSSRGADAGMSSRAYVRSTEFLQLSAWQLLHIVC